MVGVGVADGEDLLSNGTEGVLYVQGPCRKAVLPRMSSVGKGNKSGVVSSESQKAGGEAE